MLTSPTCATVEFELPDWCADSRFQYERKIYHSNCHAYAGQLNRIDLENKMSEALFTIDGMDEVCLHHCNCWCRVHIEFSSNFMADVEKVREKIHRVLSRYKEAKNGATNKEQL